MRWYNSADSVAPPLRLSPLSGVFSEGFLYTRCEYWYAVGEVLLHLAKQGVPLPPCRRGIGAHGLTSQPRQPAYETMSAEARQSDDSIGDEAARNIQFACPYCDETRTTEKLVRIHITNESSGDHRDRNGFEPGVVVEAIDDDGNVVEERDWETPADGQRGELAFSLVPDDITEKKRVILTAAILNPTAGYRELLRYITSEFYGGDEDEAPSYSYVYETVNDYDLPNDRQDGRKKLSGAAAASAEQVQEEEQGAEETESESETTEVSEPEPAPVSVLEQEDYVDALISLVKTGEPSDEQIRRFVAEIEPTDDMTFSKADALQALRELITADVDRELVQKMAAHMERKRPSQ